MALNKYMGSSSMRTGGSINSTQVIRENVDDEQLNKELAKASIFFNVSKIYLEFDVFTFESRIYIKCGNFFKMEIVEIWQKKFSFKDENFSIKNFKKIVKALYKASIQSMEQHIEHSKSRMPNIVISPNVLKNYLLSTNYNDLYKSCFLE